MIAIAGGIILAVLILAYIREILAFILVLAIAAVIVGVIGVPLFLVLSL